MRNEVGEGNRSGAECGRRDSRVDVVRFVLAAVSAWSAKHDAAAEIMCPRAGTVVPSVMSELGFPAVGTV